MSSVTKPDPTAPEVTKPRGGRPAKYGRPLTGAERVAHHRARRRGAAAAEQVEVAGDPPLPVVEGDPVTLLVEWARSTLVVPPGHPAAGEPMAIPDYGVAFLRDALTHRESLLCMARKNAKSAIAAVLVLGYLAGPLRAAGWRGAVCSINKSKAGELKRQVQEIAEASRIGGLRFLRSPAPGRVEAQHGATLDILSADASAGAASGFDLVIVDELGLLQERDRALLSGLRSSTSARRGRFVAISIQGDGPFIPELLERRDDPAVAVHAYIPADGADPCAAETWEAGNPGLGTIKDRLYMVDRARLSAMNPSDLALFSAEDCNLPGSPGREMIVTPAAWSACAGDAERAGDAVVGFDAGGSASLTAAAVVWPDTGRIEVYAGAPVAHDFDLLARGRHDSVGRRYQELADRGELFAYPGRRTTPAALFLADVADAIQGVKVAAIGADRYRQSEVVDFMADAKLSWPVVWRGQGAGATADGSADVRAFQRSVLDKWFRVAVGNLLMVHAIAESAIRYDPAGNPAVEKGRNRGRIDPLQAAVIAAGLAERRRHRHRQRYRSMLLE